MTITEHFTWPEVSIFLVTLGILVTYHIHLIWKVKHTPLKTAVGITNHAREKWVASVMADRRDILAVQTLRNWVVATNFLASTAMLMSLGTISAGFTTENSFSSALNIIGSTSSVMWTFKMILLCVLFFTTFFNFTLAIRYYNHAALMINTSEKHDPTLSVEAVTRVINHGALHYTMGMRGFYLAVPLALWLFGPLWMLMSTFGFIVVVYRLDCTV